MTYFEPEAEFFDRTSVPKEIADLLDEWPEIGICCIDGEGGAAGWVRPLR